MVTMMYSFYDRVAEEYAPPFLMRNDAMAIRAATANLSQTPYPEDFVLYELGSFDTTLCKFALLDKPRLVPFAMRPVEPKSDRVEPNHVALTPLPESWQKKAANE